MRPQRRTLKLSRETLRNLAGDLSVVAGGTTTILIEPLLKSLDSL